MREFADYFSLRKSIYLTLAFPFHKEPGREYLERLEKYLPVLESAGESLGNHALMKSVQNMAACLPITDPEKLAGIFALLFLGVNKAAHTGHTVTPHESVYLPGGRLVMQEPWEELCELFYREGVAKNASFMEPEDHISSEMAFMAHMSAKTARLMTEGDEAGTLSALETQAEFLEKHLCRWVNRFTQDIYISVDNEFYRAAAQLTEAYLQYDKEFLEELMKPV